MDGFSSGRPPPSEANHASRFSGKLTVLEPHITQAANRHDIHAQNRHTEHAKNEHPRHAKQRKSLHVLKLNIIDVLKRKSLDMLTKIKIKDLNHTYLQISALEYQRK